MDYQKSNHFSKAWKDSSVYVYQLHTWINRSKIRCQRDPKLDVNGKIRCQRDRGLTTHKLDVNGILICTKVL